MKKSLTPLTPNLRRTLAVLPLILIAGTADAAIVTYTGNDQSVAAGGARPNSDAARAAFLGAVTPTGTITFEGLALGNFGALGVAPGVTATLTGQDTIAGIQNANDTTLGYNTTSGGSQHLRMAPPFNSGPATATFNFATPISAFGAYLTGTEVNYPGAINILFFDGSSQSLNVTKNNNGGGVQFFGFTTDALLISSVQFYEGPTANTRDIWGIDDVTYGAVAGAVVPEPSTYIAGALLLLPFGSQVIRRLRTSKQV
jgi:hypothetical protein